MSRLLARVKAAAAARRSRRAHAALRSRLAGVAR
jgi:hypothetical protein